MGYKLLIPILLMGYIGNPIQNSMGPMTLVQCLVNNQRLTSLTQISRKLAFFEKSSGNLG